jgi:hypothetical protein
VRRLASAAQVQHFDLVARRAAPVKPGGVAVRQPTRVDDESVADAQASPPRITAGHHAQVRVVIVDQVADQRFALDAAQGTGRR